MCVAETEEGLRWEWGTRKVGICPQTGPQGSGRQEAPSGCFLECGKGAGRGPGGGLPAHTGQGDSLLRKGDFETHFLHCDLLV